MMELTLRPISRARLSVPAYVEGMPGLFERSGDHARYAHPTTGVELPLRVEHDGLMVRIPLLRPSFWGREAGIVLERLGRACGLGIEGAPVDRSDIAARWEEANRQAWRLDTADDRPVLPDAAVDLWWQWNYELPEVRPLYTDAYVPAVQIVWWGEGWRSAAIWTDLAPILLPPVDVVLVLCAALAARGLPPGLVAVQGARIEALTGEIPISGVGVAKAASQPSWIEVVRGGSPVPGRLKTLHPVDGVEQRYRAPK